MATRSTGSGKSTSRNTKKGATKTNTKRGNTKRKKKDITNLVTVDDSIRDEAVLLCILGVSILIYLALFGILGSFGKVLQGFFFGVFGIVSYIVPVVIFFSAAFYISNRGKSVAYIKVIFAFVLLLILMSLSELMFDKDFSAVKITEYYTHCSEAHKGGGIIGGIISSVLTKTIGTPGTYIVLIILSIVAIVLITERSFFSGVKHGSETIYNSSKDYSIKYKDRRDEKRRIREEHNRQRLIEKEKLRKDKVVSGVMLNTKLTPPVEDADDIHEIKGDGSISDVDVTKWSRNDINEAENLEAVTPNINIRTIHNIEIDDEKEFKISKPFISDVTDDDEIISYSDNNDSNVYEDSYANTTLNGKINITGENIVGHGEIKEKEKQTEYEDSFIKSENLKPIKKPVRKKSVYKFPPITLLKSVAKNVNTESVAKLRETAAKLQTTLKTFGVNVTITDIAQGPSVTRYEMQPEVGTKVSKITNLQDDIKLNMAARDIRIEAPIPGKAAVGIEIPNKEVSMVSFRELIDSKEFKEANSKISFAVGKDLSGSTVVADIGKMPHLLIAGSTGSGKSVCINTLIMSIIYKATPDEVKLIMVDPKVVELSVYNGIPHLMIPVVTDPKKAAAALNWGVAEMTDRYNKFAEFGVRDLKGYNKKLEQVMANVNEAERPKKLPQIVIIVDELADLMMVASNEVEASICRLAQLARAAGIHLVIATQRPSVDVITGLIKANMPSRIAFAVSSGVDSRTILDMNGAERLLGKGDMLFYPQGYTKPSRVQGAFISDEEISEIVDFLKANCGEGYYDEDVLAKVNSQALDSNGTKQGLGGNSQDNDSDKDQYFIEAARLVIEQDKASIGYFQRRFKIGFNRAARIMDQLFEAGIVSQEEGTKPRKVLMSMEEFENALEQGEF